MKKRILAVFSMIFVLGLFASAFALNIARTHKTAACPVMEKQAPTVEQTDMSKVVVYTDGDDCCAPGADCCKGGSCCHKKK